MLKVCERTVWPSFICLQQNSCISSLEVISAVSISINLALSSLSTTATHIRFFPSAPGQCFPVRMPGTAPSNSIKLMLSIPGFHICYRCSYLFNRGFFARGYKLKLAGKRMLLFRAILFQYSALPEYHFKSLSTISSIISSKVKRGCHPSFS